VHVNAATLLTLAAITAGCVAGANMAEQPDAKIPTDPNLDDRSYALGVDVARTALAATLTDGISLDRDDFLRGITDVLKDQELAFGEGHMRRALEDLELEVATREAEARLREDPIFRLTAEANAARGREFQDKFATRVGVVKLPSGVQYESLEEGDGPRAANAVGVQVVYTGATAAGTRFAESVVIDMELEGMLPAVASTIRRMRVGDRWIVVIPPESAFGIAGHDTPLGERIGPNETLVTTVELLEVTE